MPLIKLNEEFINLISQHIDFSKVLHSIFPAVIGAHVGSSVIALGYFVIEK